MVIKNTIKKLPSLIALLTLIACARNGLLPSSSVDDSAPSSKIDDNTSSISSSQSIESGDTVTIFSINDFHGKIKNDSSYNGILANQGAIKSNPLYKDGESLILSAGDMWQGSYVSGYDKGLSTTKLMNEFSFDAMTLGNHEFDWGIDYILTNAEAANFPFLCANLIPPSGETLSPLIKDHVVLDAGNYKIGVVGAIGMLSSSIKESALGGYSFDSDMGILRNSYNACIDEGANAVILLAHDDKDSNYINIIQQWDIPFIGIFGGHSHSFQLDKPTGQIPYVQGGSDSRGYSYMTIDKSTNTLVDINYTYVDEAAETYADLDFKAMVDELLESREAVTLGYMTGYWTKEKSANLVLRAMFEMAKKWNPDKNYDTDTLIAIHNTAGIRSYFPASTGSKIAITMEDIQLVCPFDNTVKILPSRTIASVNHYTYPQLSSCINKTMDIVTIDYLVSDKYNKSMFTPTGAQDVKEGETVIIYDLVAEYIMSFDGETISSSNY